MDKDSRLVEHIIDIKAQLAALNEKQDTLIKTSHEQSEILKNQSTRISNLESLKNKMYGAAAVVAAGVGVTGSWVFNIFKGH